MEQERKRISMADVEKARLAPRSAMWTPPEPIAECPFCGGNAEAYEIINITRNLHEVGIHCTDCDANVCTNITFDTEYKANKNAALKKILKSWNTRTAK